MLGTAPISISDLHLIHSEAINEPTRVREFLTSIQRHGTRLWRGMNRNVVPEIAEIVEVGDYELILETKNFAQTGRSQIFLNTSFDGRGYFFASPLLSQENASPLRVGLPSVVWRTDRRDRGRVASHEVRAEFLLSGEAIDARVIDASPGGLGLHVESRREIGIGSAARVRFLQGNRAGEEVCGVVRNAVTRVPAGWQRVGLAVLPVPLRGELVIERRTAVAPGAAHQRAWRRLRLSGAGALHTSRKAIDRIVGRQASTPPVNVVDYENAQGERIRSIIDASGDPRGATAVVIAPAWGRTKETLLGLSRTILATFEAAGLPVVVVRFDGVRKRGESHREPECAAPGAEHRRFTFYQGVRDIDATVDFLHADPRFQPQSTILVTFSAAAIEGRRAIAEDAGKRIKGWVSVVGAPDLQSMMRVISGGVDYAKGVERGARFGMQEILGVVVDIDLAGDDAFRHEMVYLEDSRRDFGKIRVPVLWLHGRDDAWMDLSRVRDVLSVGDTSARWLVEVPTGHMLKSSREALDVFQLVAVEIARMATGRSVNPALPDLGALEAAFRAERGRLRSDQGVALRDFWSDYLLGRSRRLGIELMNETSAYRDLMDLQIRALDLDDGQRIADLGSGTGPVVDALLRDPARRRLQLDQFDYVIEGLRRSRAKAVVRPDSSRLRLNVVSGDMAVGKVRSLPIRDGAYDAVLASLVLSYVDDPGVLLDEIHRILRPGGRVVVSTMKPDADVSKIYVEGLAELRSGVAREAFGPDVEAHLDELGRAFLNDAARLLDLEEQGLFRFWAAEELSDMLRRAGFLGVQCRAAFGSPPQAVVASAIRA